MLHLVGILFPHVKDDAGSESLKKTGRQTWLVYIEGVRGRVCFGVHTAPARLYE